MDAMTPFERQLTTLHPDFVMWQYKVGFGVPPQPHDPTEPRVASTTWITTCPSFGSLCLQISPCPNPHGHSTEDCVWAHPEDHHRRSDTAAAGASAHCLVLHMTSGLSSPVVRCTCRSPTTPPHVLLCVSCAAGDPHTCTQQNTGEQQHSVPAQLRPCSDSTHPQAVTAHTLPGTETTKHAVVLTPLSLQFILTAASHMGPFCCETPGLAMPPAAVARQAPHALVPHTSSMCTYLAPPCPLQKRHALLFVLLLLLLLLGHGVWCAASSCAPSTCAAPAIPVPRRIAFWSTASTPPGAWH